MRTRENHLFVEILLLIVITSIIVYTCVNFMNIVNMFAEAVGDAITKFNLGF